MPARRRPLLAFVLLLVGAASTSAAGAADDELFEKHVHPILAGVCFRCHGDQKVSGELRVDSRDALVRGGESGPAIVPGAPEESLLVRAVRRQEDVAAMPPDKPLAAEQVAALAEWIRAGAPWPAHDVHFEPARHWSFQPLGAPAVPPVADRQWVRTAIDAFIRARQEAAGIPPAPPAERRALIRRATFDLTGLPPTPEEVAAFLADPSPDAFAAVVDRLLASPHYGEHWGRHWLDVVRYADTAGETADYPAPLAWRYRNYVIDALNADRPYDEFLREQIAGDVLAEQGPPERYAQRVAATGYLAIARRFGFDSENYHHLTIADTIDTLGQSVLGLSLGCARCHDHKFDPVSMRDYYGLYGIFDSSRYAFPGSEQKQKLRALAPLVPPSQSQPLWRQFDSQLAALAARQRRPGPAALVRSLHDIDGDFELQAAAAGGSNGVLVPPWLYEGRIAVTTAAQSPYKNLYPGGKVGASVPADGGEYRIVQAIHPRRTRESCRELHVNLDFRVSAAEGAATAGAHRFWIGAQPASPAVEVLIAADGLSLRAGDAAQSVRLEPNRWYNLQLALDLPSRTFSGAVGVPDNVTALPSRPLAPLWSGTIDFVALDCTGPAAAARPAIELDNLGVQEETIPAVSLVAPAVAAANLPDALALGERLQAIVGFDGDFEMQPPNEPPAAPWGPGPNSVVRVSPAAQSPFCNVFAAGELGIHLPNRGHYDGFGRTLPTAWKAEAGGRLFASFDFRCGEQAAGGGGSWRYYLGHGPGNSAAVELFFNGETFFRRSGDERAAVCPLARSQWHQAQLALDLAARTYRGLIASDAGQTEFGGQLASGWDGVIDHTFIDSYGHLGGVRPALDADNFSIGEAELPPLAASLALAADNELRSRRDRATALRQQLAALEQDAQQAGRELESLLAAGPCELAYGVAEGTPHNVRMQLRGEPAAPGDEVPRGLIASLGGGPLPADVSGSGRRELAQWLGSPQHPLTARVLVNRIWQWHFGRGLVGTPNDFGARGLPPTHPELLDYLATRFIEGGWSIKALHRLIMSSATYQQSASTDGRPSAASGADAAELYAVFPRRRLSAEEIRDSILAIAGTLDRTPGREHPFPAPTSWGFTQHAPFIAVYDHNRRSVYLMTQRIKRHPFLALFDGADPNATTGLRLGTTVPTQALYFLNDPFVHTSAAAAASRLAAAQPFEAGRIAWAHELVLGRPPTDLEQAEAAEFLAAYRAAGAAAAQGDVDALAAFVRVLLGSNEFVHVD